MKKHFADILLYIVPLIALATAGITLQRWHQALYPDIEPSPQKVRARISPEEFSAGMEEMLESLAIEAGLSSEQVSRRKPGIDEGIQYVYTVRVPINSSQARFHLMLDRIATEQGGGIMESLEASGGRTLTLTLGVGETPTDVVVFRKTDGVRSSIAKMAIIVDDLGIRSTDSAKRLCDIDQELTLSILPFQRHTGDVVQLARRTETPYMLHMPMEPLSASADPGEGAITADDPEADITRKLIMAWGEIPGAKGMNNHMGSRATESRRVMAQVMDFLGENRYFFVDSRTSNATAGFELSRSTGVRGAMMDGYLDVEDDEAFISRRLDELAERARTTGMAVVICHDRPATVAVLERKMPQLAASGIRFVPVEEIIR